MVMTNAITDIMTTQKKGKTAIRTMNGVKRENNCDKI